MVTVRPIQHQDTSLLAEMFRFCSEQSLYQRYLRSYNPDEEEIAQLCAITPNEGKAFVAIVEKPYLAIVGVGYYMLDGDGTAEPAIIVEDDFHNQGIGKRLMAQLTDHARQRGISAFNAYVLADNRPMLRILTGSGMRYDMEHEYGTLYMRIWLNQQQQVA